MLKRLVRDIIDPDRDLGHVDGKKKSTTTTASTSVSSSAQPHRPNAPDRDDSSRELENEYHNQTQSVARAQQSPARRPRAISNLQGMTGDGERKFTPMDVDGVEMEDEHVQQQQGQVRRNPDGSICEDC